jgi:hypothetical protein
MADDVRESILARDRKRRQREREKHEQGERERHQQLVVVTSPVTPPQSVPGHAVTSPLTPSNPTLSVTSELVTSRHGQIKRDSIVLMVLAFALFIVGLCSNALYAHNLATTELAGWLFVAVGVLADCLAFVLPDRAMHLCREGRFGIAGIAWAVWGLTSAFALYASVGFASINIADTTMARAGRTTPAVEVAQRGLNDAKAARDRECVKLGPICRQREDAVRDRQTELREAMAKVGAAADPQTDATAKLIRWVSRGSVRPSADDFEMLRLFLMTLLPQLGGLVLMVARR